MYTPLAMLRAVGKAMLNAAGAGMLGDLAVEVLPGAARDVWAWWRAERSGDQCRAEIEALAQAPAAEVRAAAQAVATEVAGDQPAEVQLALVSYLTQVPAAVRQSLRRPADPAGRTVPARLPLDEPEDLLTFLPAHRPRFQPGDRPLPGIDWQLEELLGVGGFGEVWKARNPHFDGLPPVALKFCLEPEARDRLLRHEAAVLNQVMRHGRHPGIVALRQTYLSADPPCLEYEYVSGGDLAGLMLDAGDRRDAGPTGSGGGGGTGALPVRVHTVCSLILQLADTVGFAHRLSPPIVHRDLKPANILVELDGEGKPRLRVADFGIGGLAASQAIAQTRQGTSEGGFLATALRGAHTPLYASPQQMRGRPPDPRDDVHAIGVIWYQLLTGSLTAGRPGGSRWAQRLRDLGVSQPLVDLLGACVEEEPDDRPADARALADQLRPLLDTTPAVPRIVAAPPPPAAPALPSRQVNGIGLQLALIPAGTFLMGSPPSEKERGEDEGPQHRVEISRPFYMGVYPVTQREYEVVMGACPSGFGKKAGGGPDHPVEQVAWDEAVAFCRRLSELARRGGEPDRYRLPTEAEWEYACRAGTTTPFGTGATLSPRSANFDGTKPYGNAPRGPSLGRTRRGESPRDITHPWGLAEMHGNVWEWCADWYHPGYYAVSPPRDPAGPDWGDRRVVRGGSWQNSGQSCRSARRFSYPPSFRNDNIGFRVVLETPAQ